MRPERLQRLRSAAFIAAIVILGISWSFALVHISTGAYPLLWAAAMPFLAFYYVSGPQRTGLWKHLPAGALTIYAVVLWRVTRGYGAAGALCTAGAILASLAAVWLGGRLSSAARPRSATPAAAPRAPVAAAALGSGVARRRRLRTGAARR